MMMMIFKYPVGQFDVVVVVVAGFYVKFIGNTGGYFTDVLFFYSLFFFLLGFVSKVSVMFLLSYLLVTLYLIRFDEVIFGLRFKSH